MSAARHSRPSSFAGEARGLALAWLALLTLMMLSLGSAYLHLGIGNIVASLVIASIKTAIVAWWFMHLRVESVTLRTTALLALFMLALLSSLSGVDYSTRRPDPAAVQAPQQIEPLLQKERAIATRR